MRLRDPRGVTGPQHRPSGCLFCRDGSSAHLGPGVLRCPGVGMESRKWKKRKEMECGVSGRPPGGSVCFAPVLKTRWALGTFWPSVHELTRASQRRWKDGDKYGEEGSKV